MPQEKTVIIGYRGTPDFRRWLRLEAAKRGTSIQEMVHRAVEAMYVDPVDGPDRELLARFKAFRLRGHQGSPHLVGLVYDTLGVPRNSAARKRTTGQQRLVS